MPENGGLLVEEEEEDFWTKLEREKMEKKRQEEESRRIIEQKKAEAKAKAEAAKKAAREKALKKLKGGGFMTAERKKKLRVLLRKKAAEELKKEQERKAAEKKAAIDKMCGQPKDLNNPRLGEADFRAICEEYYNKIQLLEGQKYDLEYITKLKIFEIKDLNRKVNETRGKFIKPPMKKVPKFELTRPPIPKPELTFSPEKLKSTKKGLDLELDLTKKKEKPVWALPKDQRPKSQPKKATDEETAEGEHAESAETNAVPETVAENTE